MRFEAGWTKIAVQLPLYSVPYVATAGVSLRRKHLGIVYTTESCLWCFLVGRLVINQSPPTCPQFTAKLNDIRSSLLRRACVRPFRI